MPAPSIRNPTPRWGEGCVEPQHSKKSRTVSKGHWVWSERARLDFGLDQPLPAGHRFTVKPAADAEQQTGRILQVAGEITFQTRSLSLDNCRLEAAPVAIRQRASQPAVR